MGKERTHPDVGPRPRGTRFLVVLRTLHLVLTLTVVCLMCWCRMCFLFRGSKQRLANVGMSVEEHLTRLNFLLVRSSVCVISEVLAYLWVKPADVAPTAFRWWYAVKENCAPNAWALCRLYLFVQWRGGGRYAWRGGEWKTRFLYSLGENM
jgi:hypothetical protein